MIPYRLRLQNFLSYQAAVLDFQGLHTACICGANGAGKSSLLEAMTWALWGQSRVAVEDDVIHLGASEVQVDFIFRSQGQLYRVLRSRHRNQASQLEFQVARSGQPLDRITLSVPSPSPASAPALNQTVSQALDLTTLDFRSLTAKGVRATQQLIVQTLKLDYETFISSAYLRQGRADEFMLKRPSERKQVLADLLKLDQYDGLAEKAKDQARTYRAQALALEQSLGHNLSQLQQRDRVETELASLNASLDALQAEQQHDRDRLSQLQQQQQQHHRWEQELQLQQQEHQRLEAMGDRLGQEQNSLEQQQVEHNKLLGAREAIEAGFRQWQDLQAMDAELLQVAEQHQQLKAQYAAQQQERERERFELQRQQERIATQQQTLEHQAEELKPILARETEISQALEQLQQAREQLRQFDRLEALVSPLLLRHQDVESQLKQTHTQLATRLETLQGQQQSLQSQQGWLPHFQAEYESTTRQVDYLAQRQVYQEQVLDKGLERRSFLDRLKAHLLDYQAQLMTIERKVAQIASSPPQSSSPKSSRSKSSGSKSSRSSGSDSASLHRCPQCDRPMDEKHRAFALAQYEQERQNMIDQITVVADQISVSKKEIAVLRQEYRAISRELKGYAGFLQRKGQLRQQLAASIEMGQQQQSMGAEIEKLQAQLTQQQYEPELQREYQQLQQTLAELDYDDRNHAIARGEVERWRWAHIKQSELRQAQQRRAKLDQQRPQLQDQYQALQTQLEQLTTQINREQETYQQALQALDYDPDAHQDLRRSLTQAQTWQLQYQSLEQVLEQRPRLEKHVTELAERRKAHHQAQSDNQQQLQVLAQCLEQSTDPSDVLQALETQIQNRRQRLDCYLAEQGRLQQQQQHLNTLHQQYAQQQQQLQQYHYQQRVHRELAQAFGKNGIQALMIENVLPQLERETNQILSRLSNHQLHVQFITQKAKRKRSSRADHLIDTLDIRIADAKGTRPYETYSGGEAFRVNFSIRLALARLLAQRSGTALQLLIVDEGFGTQDAEGCDRLIAAINAIAPDFARILTITHMPQFKEAFQARIEVSKTDAGSTLAITV